MKDIKINKKYIIICSIIFSIFIMIGYSFDKIESWDLVFGTQRNIILSVVEIIILSVLLTIIFHIIVDGFKWFSKLKFKDTKINRFFSKHIFSISIITMLVGWAIYIIAFYPTIITIDAYNQLKQFFGLNNYYTDASILLSEKMLITNHHPVLHTLLLGISVKFGQLIKNDNLGLFCYTILQGGILVSTLAYTLKYLKQQNVKNRFLYIVLAIYTLVPIFPFYAMTATKDVLYTSFVILFIIEIHKLLSRNKRISVKKVIYLILLSVLVSLARNNGIIIVIPIWLIMLFYNKENRKQILSILLSFALITVLYLQIILPYFKIAQISKREVLSIPFQQTARYVKYYNNEVTEEEKKAINNVLSYDIIQRVYIPTISDPVKGTYNKNATKEDLYAYFKVWAIQFTKHPGVYLQATINNIYGYFYPSISQDYLYYQDINNPLLKIIANYGYMNFNEKFMDWHFNSLDKLRNSLVKNAKRLQYFPITGGLVNIAINNWLIILLVAYLISKKSRRKDIILLMPSIISLLMCLVSAVDNCFRYAMPIIFSNMLILLLITNTDKEQE